MNILKCNAFKSYHKFWNCFYVLGDLLEILSKYAWTTTTLEELLTLCNSSSVKVFNKKLFKPPTQDKATKVFPQQFSLFPMSIASLSKVLPWYLCMVDFNDNVNGNCYRIKCFIKTDNSVVTIGVIYALCRLTY